MASVDSSGLGSSVDGTASSVAIISGTESDSVSGSVCTDVAVPVAMDELQPSLSDRSSLSVVAGPPEPPVSFLGEGMWYLIFI